MTVSHENSPILWIVSPCYNEEEVLPLSAPLLLQQLNSMIDSGAISDKSKLCFVNDGSSDKTWQIINNLAKENEQCEGVSLSRNRGHQNALLAGLMESRRFCDITITIDCDGQDDISVMSDMIQAYKDGADVVYGVRSSRDSDTFFKRFSAESFYKLLNKMGAEVVFNHADYRLMSKKALNGLSEFKEVNLFLRGLVPLIGYDSTTVEYSRAERMAGSSHYPLKKMLALAFDGITSLSIKPIRFISGVGILFSLLGFAGALWAIITAFAGLSITGWASTICIICLIGGIQLIALGIIGEYIGKIYLETKQRPRYIINKKTWDK